MMDLGFQLFITLYFQSGLILYSNAKIHAITVGSHFIGLDCDDAAYATDMRELKKDLSTLAMSLYQVMAVSLLNLLMPISEFGKYILISKTNRAPESVGGEFYTEFALFVLTIIGWNDMVIRFSSPTYAPENEFIIKM